VLPELGYEQSAMDPRAFKFIGVNENGVHELQGLVIVEVDDLLCVGNAAREKGCSVNGRRLRVTNERYKIDVTKFANERLQPMPFQNGRKQGDPATQQETRTAVGAGHQRLEHETKKYPDMSIKIQSVPEKDMCFGVITDASYGNTEICSVGKGNLIYWRSGKIHRVVNSTLAAETQSLGKGLQELAWSITVYNELSDPNFDLRRWEAGAKSRRMSAIAKENLDETLRKVSKDAVLKSLLDHLVKSTVG
ncbi:Copia protein, partial [Durusdinium trenchii]